MPLGRWRGEPDRVETYPPADVDYVPHPVIAVLKDLSLMRLSGDSAFEGDFVGTTGRHRTSSSILWLPVIVSALIGVTFGSGVTAVAMSDPDPPAITPAAAPSSDPAPPLTLERPVGSIGFSETTIGPDGLSLTVLPPEKVKGGIRLTIALANDTSAPITVNTGDLGPHDVRFNDTTVPMTAPLTKKKLMPGEGYTYQCVLKLPSTNVGQLEFSLGSVTVVGEAAGD